MITKDSLFMDFVQTIVAAGACSKETPFSGIPFLEELSKICGEKATCDDVMVLHEANDKVNDEWVGWVIIKIGREMEERLRYRYMSKITNPTVAFNILKQCDFLTVEDIVFLKSTAENTNEVQKLINAISNPMEAARMLIDHPYLTDTQEMILRDKLGGKLPTIEKELATGVVLTAKSQVVK